MTDLSEATPRPWTYGARTPERSVKAEIEDKISCDDFPFVIWIPDPPFALGACGMLIAKREGFTAKPGEAEANAALILAAVNAHDTAQNLAKAVLATATVIATRDFDPRGIPSRQEWQAIVALAREFQKAGGE